MSSDPSPSSARVSVELDLVPEIGAVLVEAGAPALRRVRLTTTEALADLTITLTTEPAFGEERAVSLSRLDPGRPVDVLEDGLVLDGAWLRACEEGHKGAVKIRVEADGAIVGEARQAVHLAAPAHWPGVRVYPELLAAWVRPNARALVPLLAEADRILEARTGQAGLDGLQRRDPKRAWHLAASLYEAVRARDIRYIDPPASFEQLGQRVRSHEEVLSGLATCLDLAVLFAALLEQAGLHAFVVAVDGHAFAGAWLTDFHLPTPTTDDPAVLRKRLGVGEAVVFDSSPVTQGASFEEAVRSGEAELDPESFVALIDIRACRTLVGVRPLALEALDASTPQSGARQDLDASAPSLPDERFADDDISAHTRSRLEGWASRLLDLTLRNRLLNLRETKRTVRLLGVDLPALEDSLEEGRTFDVLPRPPLNQGGEEAVDPEAVRHAQQAGRLVVDLTEAELDGRLVELYRRSRSTVQDSGAHTLYLALGILQWFESRSATQPRLAPLLLVPVELVRKPGGRGYAIARVEDETRVNATLLEKLRKDFGVTETGLDEPPTDEAGVDVAAVLRLARRAVMALDRWDVLDEAWLGQFSFTKHLMWRDLLAQRDALLANPIVDHLFSGGGTAFPLAADLVPLDAVDTTRPPEEVMPVVPADPSQLQAVLAASDGSSFVLQGPPGTGKSQTITNLIAQLLGEGRTVLFVSEKRAALEVVQRRLEAVGLGPFSLELHSHQASKKAVMRQLGASFAAASDAPDVGWPEHAARLAAARASLDAHAARLAAPSPFGTVRDVVAELFGLQDVQPVPLGLDPLSLDAAAIEERTRVLRRLADRLGEIGEPAHHPWRDVTRTTWEPAWARELTEAARDAAEALDTLRAAVVDVRGRLELATPDNGGDPLDQPAGVEALVAVARGLADAPALPAEILTGSGYDDRLATLRAWIADGRSLRQDRTSLQSRWTDALLGLSLDELEARYRRWGTAFFLVAFFMLWGARSTLRGVARDGLPDARAITTDLATARAVRDGLSELDARDARARGWLGSLWRGAETDWDEASVRLEAIDAQRAALLDLAALLDRTLGGLGTATTASTDPEALRPSDREALDRLIRAHQAWSEAAARWSALAGSELPDTPLDALAARLHAAAAAPDRLRPWCAVRRALDTARELALDPLCDPVLDGSLDRSHLVRTWHRSIRQAWWEAHLRREPGLAAFRGVEHADVVRRFQDLDEGALSLARQEIVARVAARVPDLNGPGDDLGFLRRQLQLQRRHQPVRRLFARIGPLLKRITPCALMSPLSVAQYLDPSLPGYDVVVFDEASQIPPWDAVGAIARGSQVIVVGDSKQLPPTSFFDAGGDDEDEVLLDEDLVETESILDEVVAAGLRELRLRWHYRSEHESLIAFSNHTYYDNELHTLPAAVREGLGVELRPVPDGFYDRGRSRTNRGEAEAITAEVVRLLRLPESQRPTVGVVTFSSAQQRLIQDLLDAACAEDRTVEAAFSDDLPEPAFVKNLESVQGDERDVMLFSIGYGPDRAGKLTMNFGPLNRRGGERRLNVAVTRARRRLLVYSTLRADQIDLTRTRAVGVEHLKRFLSYAEHGIAALDHAARPATEATFESPFEEQVFEALTRAGHTVHTQVGVSGYRIDLAVVDPEAPGRYLLAIECDGAAYHSAHGARERDRLRQAVLERLGWRFHRVWSTDWWYERRAAEARLLEAVQDAIDAPRHTTPVVSEPPPATAPGELDPDALASLVEETESRPTRWPEQASAWTGLPAMSGGDKERFHDVGTRGALGSAIRQLVEEAGPLPVDAVYRTIATTWGFGRTGRRIRETLEQALHALPATHRPVIHGEHLWPASLAPETWRGFRYVEEGGPDRDAAEVSPEEVANVAAWMIEEGVSMSRESLYRECARVLGASQLGRRVRERMEAGVDELVRRGEATEDGERLRRPEA